MEREVRKKREREKKSESTHSGLHKKNSSLKPLIGKRRKTDYYSFYKAEILEM